MILLTDQDGLYTADPRKNKDAKLIRNVDTIDEHIIEIAGGSGTTLGTGGMATKIKAAQVAIQAGVEMIIASGENPSIILELVHGQGNATFFKPSKKPVLARKSWISSATRALGSVTIDDGAVNALVSKGSSLLPKGIVNVHDLCTCSCRNCRSCTRSRQCHIISKPSYRLHAHSRSHKIRFYNRCNGIPPPGIQI